MNRGQGLRFVVFLIAAAVPAYVFAGAQTVDEPARDRQTIQQPRPPTRMSPTKTDVRTIPIRPKGSITSAAANHCVNDLYMDIKDTHNRISKLCAFIPAPSFQAYSSLRGQLISLNFDWQRSNCQTQAIPETIKNEVNAIYSSGIAEATSKCMNSCLNVVDGQVSAGDVNTALSQCRSCCDFLPEGNKTECQVHCSEGMKQQQVAERIRDEAKGGANRAKEYWKEALRLLREMADRQSENVGTITD